jgi:hypothetical protein
VTGAARALMLCLFEGYRELVLARAFHYYAWGSGLGARPDRTR